MSSDENPLVKCVIEAIEGLPVGNSVEESLLWLLQSIPPNLCCGYQWS